MHIQKYQLSKSSIWNNVGSRQILKHPREIDNTPVNKVKIYNQLKSLYLYDKGFAIIYVGNENALPLFSPSKDV